MGSTPVNPLLVAKLSLVRLVNQPISVGIVPVRSLEPKSNNRVDVKKSKLVGRVPNRPLPSQQSRSRGASKSTPVPTTVSLWTTHPFLVARYAKPVVFRHQRIEPRCGRIPATAGGAKVECGQRVALPRLCPIRGLRPSIIVANQSLDRRFFRRDRTGVARIRAACRC
jgi:hypothetical protein